MIRPTIVSCLLLITGLYAAHVIAGGSSLTPDPLEYVSPSRPFDTIHTSLDLDIDLKNQQIAGSVTHTMRSLRERLERFDLNCVELTVESVTIDGVSVEFEYPVSGDQSTAWLGGLDSQNADDRLVIHAAAPIARDQEFEVKVTYHGSPKRGLYWVAPEKGLPSKRYEVWAQGEGEDNRFWIPCHDYPNDTATYDGRFRIERGYYVLSNGNLVSQREIGDTTEFSWTLEQPHASYLIMIAAAKYDVFEGESEGVKLMYVVPPGTDEATVTRGYGRTADMIAFFNRTIGIDYPYDKYAQVVVQNFIYGGMENTTATVMNLRTLYDEGTAITSTQDGLVAHELAHQWWGDLVTCREWSHMWLNEGFATFYQSLYRQYRQGDDAYRYDFYDRHRRVAERDDKDARPVVTDFYNRKGARNNASVYIKGSSVLNMLRFLLGDDDYHAAARLYAETNRHQPVETSDFMRAVKDATGQNMDWFFEQWIFLAGHPKFKVRKRWDVESKTLELSVQQTQETDGLVPLFRVPLDVEITTDEGVKTHRIVIDQESQEFFFGCESAPKMVIFDKGDWTLKTLDFRKRKKELLYQLEHGDYMSRVRAAKALGDEAPAGDVIEMLSEVVLAIGHWGLRREAALALGEIGDDDAMEALFDGLEVEDGRVRLACAEALGGFKRNKDAARRLTALYKNDPAWEIRAKSIDSLVKMRAAHASDLCYDALTQESGQGVVRKAALNGLVALEETRALSKIARYAAPGNDRTYRHAAIKAYARLARNLDEGRKKEAAVDFLGEMLDDWYIRTRQAVISALQSVRDASAIPHLELAARRDPLEQLRGQATRGAANVRSRIDKELSVDDVEARIKELESKLENLVRDLKEVKRDRAGEH